MRKEEIEQAATVYVDNWYTTRGFDPELYPMDTEISRVDFIEGAKWADTHRLQAFTASDQGMIDTLTNALNELSEQKAISYHKQIHWLNSLKERL